jgi:hypothetical protein
MTAPGLDLFTGKRLLKFIENFRGAQGELPTLNDLEGQGFTKTIVDQAIKENLIEKFYVTLTNGTVVKGFKIKLK